MADVIGFPYGHPANSGVPCDVEPPCEGDGHPVVTTPVRDYVMRPPHYIQNGIEAIDVIEHVVKGYSDPIEAGLIWQVLKYLIRAPFKNDKITDLRKAQFYLNRLVSKLT